MTKSVLLFFLLQQKKTTKKLAWTAVKAKMRVVKNTKCPSNTQKWHIENSQFFFTHIRINQQKNEQKQHAHKYKESLKHILNYSRGFHFNLFVFSF